MSQTTYDLSGPVTRDKLVNILGATLGLYDVQDRPYYAAGDGSTDDTAAIQNAISDAQNSGTGGVVYLPPGLYVTSAPLVVMDSEVLILGAGALATQGAAGNNDGAYTTIRPSSGWAQGTAAQPACILFDAVTPGAAVNRCGVERLTVDGTNLPGGTAMNGIATYGNCGAFSVTGCIVTSISNTSSAGIVNITGGGNTAQGNSYVRNLVQSVGGNGYDLASGDMTMDHCHSQNSGGRGISITGTGGDCRVSNCRADLSSTSSGYYLNVPCGEYLGTVQLSNCTSQRNHLNGCVIANSASAEISPVNLTGCVFQGDGTAGSTNAGIRLSGPVGAIITGCSVHVNHNAEGDGNDYPNYAIVTASDSVSAPVFLQMLGGFYNAHTAFSDKINAPLISDVRVLTWTGSQWGVGDTPTLVTAL